MFGLGVPELLFIMVLALLIFGPKKLPQIGRTLGRGMAEFRKASTELQRSMNLDLEDPPPRPKARPASKPEAGAPGPSAEKVSASDATSAPEIGPVPDRAADSNAAVDSKSSAETTPTAAEPSSTSEETLSSEPIARR